MRDWQRRSPLTFKWNTGYKGVRFGAFSKRHNAALTVMEGGEHWFHTEQQMQFLDDWIRKR